jgi:hypothetical protein
VIGLLELACCHQEELKKKYYDFAVSDKARLYFSRPTPVYDLIIEPDNSDITQLVSIDHTGEVVGYYSYEINRTTNSGYNLNILAFKKCPEFYQDFFNLFLWMFLVDCLNKVVFNIILGHPAENWYDWCCNEINGHIIGVFREDVRLIDDTLADIKYYEVIGREWLCVVKSQGYTCENYLRGWNRVHR